MTHVPADGVVGWRPVPWAASRLADVPSTAKTCCNTSVGVLIEHEARLLMFRRPDGKGIAPVAGHIVDEHATVLDAAIAEVREEVGLTVTKLHFITGGWRYNRCKRQPGPLGYGHEWSVYRAEWTGELAPSQRETREARWYGAEEIQALADRTWFAAYGGPSIINAQQWAADPGLEAVWVRWLIEDGWIRLPSSCVAQIDAFSVMGVPQA